MEYVYHRKLWDHPSIGLIKDIYVLHHTQSFDYKLVVIVSDVGESSMDFDRCVAPIMDDQSFHSNLVVDLGHLPMRMNLDEFGK